MVQTFARTFRGKKTSRDSLVISGCNSQFDDSPKTAHYASVFILERFPLFGVTLAASMVADAGMSHSLSMMR